MSGRPRTASVTRRVRSIGGKLIRRLRLLPGGVPDGLGEDDRLRGTSLSHRVLVFFADTPESLYQLAQWYGPLGALHRRHGVVVVCMDSRTAAAVRGDSGLEAIVVARDATLDDLLSRSDVKLCLYVNHNPQNFSALRFRSLVHVSMLHGDSDKSVSVSNQVKAYDFSFVAGRAAVERLAAYTTLFDAEARCILVGRPQLDVGRSPGDGAEAGTAAPHPSASARPTALYAPTWEGGQDSVAYGSVDTHGRRIVTSLLAAGFRVVYRPHPLSGVRVAAYGEADEQVRGLVSGAAAQDPGAGHLVSIGRPLTADVAMSDVLVCDVSAVANDWLPTRKPLVITVPTAGRARPAATPLLRVAPRLGVDDAARAGDVAMLAIEQDPEREERLDLVEHYLGDVAPGASMRRFLDACEHLMQIRDAEWARVRANEDADRSS